ncbi:MAG: phospho-N-acetylmuramoyl-pentapeptide-transferase, partial [Odoribacter sp.]|nr:phospho-N-acetylmuramoyl-pentapeptide-transferase [Odoribacter sp.]
MLYSLFELLQELDVPGAGVFKYVTFRAAMAAILSLYLSIIVGKRVIKVLKRQQIGEEIRDLGLEGQMEKKGTPTMGGVIIISSILIPVLLLARLSNPYIIIMLVTTIWLGVLGFADDYIKVFRKDKEGMHGRFKIVGQIGLGVIVAVSLYYINKGADIMTTIPFFK